MEQLDTDLWIQDAPLRFGGLEVGARMTVLRLPGNRLMLHSPIALSEAVAEEVQKLGTVAYLVAPNCFHHLFLSEWQQAFPEAEAFAAPGLDKKRPDLEGVKVLGDSPEAGWADQVDQVHAKGFQLLNEVLFFHRPSATLIATDLAFNIRESSPLLTRMAFSVIGSTGSVAPTLLERFFARDRKAFRRSLEQALSWPFERIVVAHGEVSESGGREELLRGYGWLLGTSS